LIDIQLHYIKGIKTDWKLDEADFIPKELFPPIGKEILPLIFKKTTNKNDNIEPTYGILEITANEHNQRKSIDIPRDKDRAGDIVSFGLPDTYGKVSVYIPMLDKNVLVDAPIFQDYIELNRKFHVRAITKRYIEEIPPLARNLDCIRPNGEIGGVGKEALPKVEFNWNWKDIALNECENTNENYIYCDSTQFAVMMNKRIHAIDEFMQGNNYTFSCPKNPVDATAEGEFEKARHNTVEEGKIGLSAVNINVNENTGDVKIMAFVQNRDDKPRTETVRMNLTVPSEVNYSGETSCAKSTGSIPSGSSANVSCDFTLPKTEEKYKIEIKLPPAGMSESKIRNSDYDESGFEINFGIEEQGNCWAQTTTEILASLFPLDIYLNAFNGPNAENVTQNTVNFEGQTIQTNQEEILNVIQAIKDLSHFNVYLMKDGFSEDFKQDFVDYYENKTFLQTDNWFSDSDPNTHNNELAEYYKEEGLLSFYRKYLSGKEYALPEPGLYHVDLIIDYAGDKWSLFDSQGNPNGTIKVEFTRLNTPHVNSVFYYLPFDGKIGEENGAYHRIGYGTGYENLSNEQMKLNSEVVMYPNETTGIPLNEVLIERSDSVAEMNSEENSRGTLFKVDYIGNNYEMKFYPSKATPVVLKMTHEQTTTDDPFSYYYGMQESGIPVLAGSNRLAYWKGLGECRDFEGKFLANYKQWDSKATSEVSNFQNQYYVKWNNAVEPGTTYLKTVFYTPIERNIQLKVAPTSSIMSSRLYTPDDKSSPIVGLLGIQGMPFNDSSSTTTNYLQNIQNVFDLVEDGSACITQNDSSLHIYWNEPNLFRQKSTKTNKSINDLEDSLIAGSTCIG
jgi:hypothetical protein